MMSSVARIASCAALLGTLVVAAADGQPLGTFSWQLQPYCNRVTFTVTQVGNVFTLDGFDDQCQGGSPAMASGVASLHANGSAAIGFVIVANVPPAWSPTAIPGGVHVAATIDLVTLSGTWTDTILQAGTFAFNASAGGSPRPSPADAAALASGVLTTAGFGGGAFFSRAYGGSAGALAAVGAGDSLGRFGAGGFSGQAGGFGFRWPTGQMTIAATQNWTPTANGTRIELATTANGSSDTATRMVINQDGFVGIGTTAPADQLDVNGNIRVGTSGTNGCVRNNNGGGLVGACASDARFKRDIVAYSNMLPRVAALRPVQFSWRADAFPEHGFGAAREAGLIAQDVEQVLPELVTTDEEGYRAVDYSKLPLIALQAIRELKERNDALEAQNAALERRMAVIESRFKQDAPKEPE